MFSAIASAAAPLCWRVDVTSRHDLSERELLLSAKPSPGGDFRQILLGFGAGKSLWRAHMNAAIRNLDLPEPVLDLGSGSVGTSSYHDIIIAFRSLKTISLDIQRGRRPDVQADAQGCLPFAKGSFSSCLALNLLEHVLYPDLLLAEIHRVLRVDGRLVIAVPFLYRIHGDPSDYFRYTRFALQALLERAGFTVDSAIACGNGAATAALSHVEFATPSPLRKPLLHAARFVDKVWTTRSGGRHRNQHDYPLGYVVQSSRV